MKQYRKRFIKDVIVEVTILSALITVLLGGNPMIMLRPPGSHKKHPTSKVDEEDIGRSEETS
jgi:hypothetical protein